MPDATTGPFDESYLSRAGAADWCAERGLRHVTVRHLAELADSGKGPPYSRMGKYVYYKRADLEAWLAKTLRPVQRARTKPKPRAMKASAR
jgi:hypothetical protein